MPRSMVSGILVNILPDAAIHFRRNMLQQLIRVPPRDFNVLPSADIIIDKLLDDDIVLAREDKLLDINIRDMKRLHQLAIELFKPELPPRTPMMDSVPFLLEALYLEYITIPDPNSRLDPQMHFDYSISSTAFTNLLSLTREEEDYISSTPPQSLIDLIMQTPLPTTPQFHRTTRKTFVTLVLTPTAVQRLYELGDYLLLSTGTERQDSAALDWILLTQMPYGPTLQPSN